jgi:large repetitive protein
MTPSPCLRRFPRLTVQRLEDRATPATALYTAATQTLTITAAQGDQILIKNELGEPSGYVQVTETQSNVVAFDSSVTHQAIKNVVARFNTVASGGLAIDQIGTIPGNLTILGANGSQTVDIAGTVGGNLTYTTPASPASATDLFTLEQTAAIGGNVTLTLGNGQNTVQLTGGTVHGNLTMTGGANADEVDLNAQDDLDVNGNAAFNLGNGTNTVLGVGTHVFRVGGNFTYTGGTGNDSIDFDSNGDTLDVAGNAKFTLGTATGFDSNTLKFEALSAHNLTFVGGAGADSIEVSGALTATGNVALTLGNGDNSFDSNLLGSGTNLIGGSFSYAGGQNDDSVQIDNTTIGRNVTIGLGAALSNANAFVGIGLKSPGEVTVYGNVTISDAASTAASGIIISRLFVGGNFAFTGGSGSDAVVMDDTNIDGNTLLNMGAGDDVFNLEQTDSNNGGPLGGTSTFGGSFTFNGGAGNDSAFLTEVGGMGSPAPGSLADFGGHVSFVGGAGADQLTINAGATFEQTGNFTDFETVTGTLP